MSTLISLNKRIDIWINGIKNQNQDLYRTAGHPDPICSCYKRNENYPFLYCLNYRNLVNLYDIKSPTADSTTTTTTILDDNSLKFPLKSIKVNPVDVIREIKSLYPNQRILIDNESIHYCRLAFLEEQNRPIFIVRCQISSNTVKQLLSVVLLLAILTQTLPVIIDGDLILEEQSKFLFVTDDLSNVDSCCCLILDSQLDKINNLSGNFTCISLVDDAECLYMCATRPTSCSQVALNCLAYRIPILQSTIISFLMNYLFKYGCTRESLKRAFDLFLDVIPNCALFFKTDDSVKHLDMLTAVSKQNDHFCDLITESNANLSLTSALFPHLIDHCCLILVLKSSEYNIKSAWMDLVSTMYLIIPHSSQHACNEWMSQRWTDSLNWASSRYIIQSESEVDRRIARSLQFQLGDGDDDAFNNSRPQLNSYDVSLNHNEALLLMFHNFALDCLNSIVGVLKTFDECLGVVDLTLMNSEELTRNILQNLVYEKSIFPVDQNRYLLLDKDKIKHHSEMAIKFLANQTPMSYIRSLVLLAADDVFEEE